MPFPSNPGIGAFPGSQPTGTGLLPPPGPVSLAGSAGGGSSFGSTETGQGTDSGATTANLGPIPTPDLSGITGALGRIGDFFQQALKPVQQVGGAFEWIAKVFAWLGSASTWKGIGLIVAGGIVVIIGAVVWSGKAGEAEKAAAA